MLYHYASSHMTTASQRTMDMLSMFSKRPMSTRASS